MNFVSGLESIRWLGRKTANLSLLDPTEIMKTLHCTIFSNSAPRTRSKARLQHLSMRIRFLGHEDDVNSVAFMDEASQVFASGSDDSFVKIWDRRAFSQSGAPCGVLVGHLEGITHIDAKGDGRYLISNSKDQTIKLWDIRKMVSQETAMTHTRAKNERLPYLPWDYRSGCFSLPERGGF